LAGPYTIGERQASGETSRQWHGPRALDRRHRRDPVDAGELSRRTSSSARDAASPSSARTRAQCLSSRAAFERVARLQRGCSLRARLSPGAGCRR